PYLARSPDGTWKFEGQPVPRSRHSYFSDHWLVRNSWVARVLVSAYVLLRYPLFEVPDPTERLVAMMRDYVEQHGARFLVGVQRHEATLESFLDTQGIPFIAFTGIDAQTIDGNHWTGKEHGQVADRLMALFVRTGIVVG